MDNQVESDAWARCPVCHASKIKDEHRKIPGFGIITVYGKEAICWRCRLSDNHCFEDYEQDRQEFIAEFVDYVGNSEIDQTHGRALSKLLLGAIVQSDPRQVCKKAIVRALHDQEKKAKKDAIARARYFKAHPTERVPNDEEIAGRALLEVGETENYMFNFLSIYNARCALASMRGIYAFLNPDFSVNEGLSGRLEKDLAGDHFLLLDEFGQENVLADFLVFIDASEINQNHHFILNGLFQDAVTTGNLQLVSNESIAKALSVEEYKSGRRRDYGNGFEDFYYGTTCNPRFLLAAMRAIYAFLTLGTSVKR